MANKIKVIIKRPDEPVGHTTTINNTLERFQMTVKGYIETVTLGSSLVMICNEEGKIHGLEKNFYMGTDPFFADVICGTVVICGTDGEEFCDIPITIDQWKMMLKLWGNNV